MSHQWVRQGHRSSGWCLGLGRQSPHSCVGVLVTFSRPQPSELSSCARNLTEPHVPGSPVTNAVPSPGDVHGFSPGLRPGGRSGGELCKRVYVLQVVRMTRRKWEQAVRAPKAAGNVSRALRCTPQPRGCVKVALLWAGAVGEGG